MKDGRSPTLYTDGMLNSHRSSNCLFSFLAIKRHLLKISKNQSHAHQLRHYCSLCRSLVDAFARHTVTSRVWTG